MKAAELLKLSEYKYTQMYKHLTDEQLTCLIWLVGEFSARLSPDFFNIDEAVGGRRRAIAALKALTRFDRDPMDLLALRQYITSAMREGERAALKRKLEGVLVVATRTAKEGADPTEALHFIVKTMQTVMDEMNAESDAL